MIRSNPAREIACPDRAAWLAKRVEFLTASDVPAAIGESPWKSRFALWAEKTGLLESEDISDRDAVKWGNRLERSVAEGFAEDTGRAVSMAKPFTIVRHPDLPFLACTPDAHQDCDRGRGNLQIKTTSAFKSKDWAVEPPLYYQVQAQVETACTDHDWGTLACLIGGQKLQWFDADLDRPFLDWLYPQVEEFWRLVDQRIVPEIDGSDSTFETLKRMHSAEKCTGESVPLPAEFIEIADRLDRARAAKKGAEDIETLCKNQFAAAMGDAKVALIPDGRTYTYAWQEKKSYTVAASKSRVLRKSK